MQRFILLICLAIFLICAVTGCSNPKAHESELRLSFHQNATAPKAGTAINWVELYTYFESSCSNLVQQGRICTNLHSQTPHNLGTLALPGSRLQPLNSVELAKVLEQSVIVVGRIVRVGKTVRLLDTATGFFVTEDGAFVTCLHVLKGDRILGFAIMTREGGVFPVEQVLASDSDNDLALLRVKGSGFVPLPVVPTISQGSPIWVMSNPQFQFFTLTTGIVSAYYSFATSKGELTMMTITADFANGSSGAPVVDERGSVVGVARFTSAIFGAPIKSNASLQMVTKTCIPSSAILNLLSRLR